jgi:hypothetical protein
VCAPVKVASSECLNGALSQTRKETRRTGKDEQRGEDPRVRRVRQYENKGSKTMREKIRRVKRPRREGHSASELKVRQTRWRGHGEEGLLLKRVRKGKDK